MPPFQAETDLPLAQPRVLITELAAEASYDLPGGLRSLGMAVDVVRLAPDTQSSAERFGAQVALLRIVPGREDGFLALEQLAGMGCGVIVFAGPDEALRVESLDRGADDVLEGPVTLRELAARIRAVHRRVARARSVAETPAATVVTLDVAHRSIIGPDGTNTPLSEAEFVALETLLDADGAPVSRDWIGRVALKRPLHADDRSVDQLVLKLRRKLTATGAADRTILSARRQGYVIPDPSRFRIAAPNATSPQRERVASDLAPTARGAH
jgi:DNA-binding response OmpR family regulator